MSFAIRIPGARPRPAQVTSKKLRIAPDGTRLYCVCSMRATVQAGKVVWVPKEINMHAMDAANARMIFFADPDNRFDKIIAIGPVVGVYVDDEHGEKLRI